MNQFSSSIRSFSSRLAKFAQCALVPGKYAVVHSGSNSIHVNLAAQQYLAAQAKAPLLLLYRNSKTIVIGKHQNPWKECHVQQMEKHVVDLCRRQSGGGAVYQDLGNSVFSFVTPELAPDQDFKTMNNGLLLGGLKRAGIDASASGRNDLVLSDGRKISGSAYKLRIRGGLRWALHHGTMLIDVDLGALQRFLNPNKLKLQSKGVASVVSRVANLATVVPGYCHEQFRADLLAEVRASLPQDTEVLEQEFSESEMLEVPRIAELRDNSVAWDWRWGKTPAFTHELENKFPWAHVMVAVDVKHNIIEKGVVWSDCLVPEFIDCMNELLAQRQEYSEAGVSKICRKLAEMRPEEAEWAQDLQNWLRSAI